MRFEKFGFRVESLGFRVSGRGSRVQVFARADVLARQRDTPLPSEEGTLSNSFRTFTSKSRPCLSYMCHIRSTAASLKPAPDVTITEESFRGFRGGVEKEDETPPGERGRDPARRKRTRPRQAPAGTRHALHPAVEQRWNT